MDFIMDIQRSVISDLNVRPIRAHFLNLPFPAVKPSFPSAASKNQPRKATPCTIAWFHMPRLYEKVGPTNCGGM